MRTSKIRRRAATDGRGLVGVAIDRLEYTTEFRMQNVKPQGVSIKPGQHRDSDLPSETVAIQSERLAQEALDPVTPGGMAVAASDDDDISETVGRLPAECRRRAAQRAPALHHILDRPALLETQAARQTAGRLVTSCGQP